MDYEIKGFRNAIEETGYQAKIKKTWYTITACIHCNQINAFNKAQNPIFLDEKIPCCATPDNYTFRCGADSIIEEFILLNGGITE